MAKEPSWIESLHQKRIALYSTTVVVETNDDQRYRQFVEYEDKQRKRLTIWDTYAGLSVRENGIETPVRPSDNPLRNKPPQETIEDILVGESAGPNQIVVIKNVLSPNDLPQKALNYWATHDAVFGREHLVVLFVPSKDFVDTRVLDKCIFVQPPLSLAEERQRELSKLLEQLGLKLSREQQTELIQLTGGLDLNQTEAVFIETLTDFALKSRLDVGLVAKVKADAINKTSVLTVKMDVDLGFEAVGGYAVVKQYIIDSLITPLKDPIRAQALGVERPRGAIIFGPGGTGKTILAKACAKELAYPFVTLSPENFMSSYVGESERNLAKAIRIIEELSPCLVFIDEIDRLGGRGQNSENDGGTGRRLFSQMLEWLGDMKRKSVVIGATNMPFMDEAFRREGRFDVMIPMLSPDLDARKEIINIHLNVVRKIKHHISQDCIETVAKETNGWKGNMLEELVKRAVRQAFLEGQDAVENKHLIDAKADYIVNIDALYATEENFLTMAKQLCNSKKFLDALVKQQMRVVSGRDAVLAARDAIAPPR